jgi:glycosyltransferase involved in cell wall biosynthesis
MGGIETYFRSLLFSLQEVDSENEYSVLCDSHHAGELAIIKANFKAVQCNYTKPSLGWLLRGVIRNTIKVDILRPVMNRFKVDVIHHPFSFLNPLNVATPSVLTFHDMQHEFFPEYFSPYEMKVRKEFYRPSAEQATRIIAISQHVKSCLVDRYEINPEKIDVVHNGFNPAYRLLDDPDSLEEVRSKYGLSRPFMYYPAATWPHKNHKTLLEALKIMKERYRFDGQLVLTGIAMRANDKILGEIVRLGLEDEVKVLGYLPYDDLPRLYNLARVMVFPSLFEGFGIPLVEAMACGCPIACSNAASIPEVVGDAGKIFDPVSVEDMAEKIWHLWSDEALRQALKIKGSARAKLFSWDITARDTVKVYSKVISR